MNALKSVFYSVLRSENKLCCVCFKTIAAEEETTRFRDQVVLETETCLETELLYNILSCVPSPEFLNSVPKSELLCIECTKSATNNYTFIQTHKKNVINLNNAIDSVARSLENSIENIHDYKSLFLSINMGERICQQYYDTSSFPTLTAALKKFNRLSQPKATLSYTKPKLSKDRSDHSTRIFLNMKNTYSTKRIRFMCNLKNETYCLIRTVDGCLRYQCKFCFQVYSDLNDLQHHECINYKAHVAKPIVALNGKSSARVCSQCCKTFTSEFLMEIHELSHIRKLVCPNLECKRVYRNRAAYLHHIEYNTCRIENVRKDSRGPKIFQCDTCKHMYATKKGLKDHIKLVHDLTFQKLECKWCGKKFIKQSTLRTHIVKHTKDKKFQCEQCGGAFVSGQSLLHHSRIHTGEKPYQCKFCDNKFVSSDRLTCHVRRHLSPTSRLYIKDSGTPKAGQKQTRAASVNNTGHSYPQAGQKQIGLAGVNNADHNYAKPSQEQRGAASVNKVEYDYAKASQEQIEAAPVNNEAHGYPNNARQMQTRAADVNNVGHGYTNAGHKQTGAAGVNNAEPSYPKGSQKRRMPEPTRRPGPVPSVTR